MIAVFIVFLAAILIFSFLFVFFGYSFRRQAHEEYSFRSYFPYELFNGIGSTQKLILRVLQGLALLSSLLPAVYGLVAIYPHETAISLYLVSLMVVYLVPAASFLSLTLINVSFPKQHMTLFFALAAGEILKTCMSGFLLITMYNQLSSSSLLAIAIALFFLAFLILLLVINPKMKTWDIMDHVTNKDGTTSFARPKWFVLAYSEWGIFFIGVASSILSQVGFYLSYFVD